MTIAYFPPLPAGWSFEVPRLYVEGHEIPDGWREEGGAVPDGWRRFARLGTHDPRDGWCLVSWSGSWKRRL